MAVVIGYLAAVTAAIVCVWAVAGRGYDIARDPQVNLAELGGRHVGILSGLGGFAVTGMVLLVTLGRNLPDTSGTPYTTVLTMFFVSWMAYAGTGFLFANIIDGPQAADRATKHGFDVTAAAFAGAGATLEIAFANGWLALRPLFQAFGLSRLSDLAAPILVVVALASYGLVSHHLHRSGYGAGRVVAAMPLLAGVATVAYGAVVGALGMRSEEATLNLIIAAFMVGAVAFAFVTALPLIASNDRLERFVAAYGRYLILAYVQAVIMLVGFLLLSVLGLA